MSARTRLLLVVALVAATAAVSLRYGADVASFFDDPGRLRARLLALGPLGPWVAIGLSAVQVLIAPIPGQAVGVANGYLYGPYVGLAISMTGLAIGSALAMGLARWLGRPLVEHFVSDATLERLDHVTSRRGSLVFFLVFLFPMLPDDAACFAIGLSSLPLGRMLALALLGRMPGTFVACFVGANAESLPTPVLAALFGGVLLIGVVAMRRAAQLEARAFEALERVEHRLDAERTEPRDDVR